MMTSYYWGLHFFPVLFYIFYPHFLLFLVVRGLGSWIGLLGLGLLGDRNWGLWCGAFWVLWGGLWGWGSLYKQRRIHLGIKMVLLGYFSGYSIDQFLKIDIDLLLQPIRILIFCLHPKVTSQKLLSPGEATRNTITILRLEHFKNYFTPRIFQFVVNTS